MSEHLLYDKSQSQCAYEMNLGKVHVGFFFDQIFDALNSTSSMGPGGFALLVEDASVDSWCREIYVPLAWRVYLTTGFDFPEKKIVLVSGRSEPGFAVSLLPCHFTMKRR